MSSSISFWTTMRKSSPSVYDGISNSNQIVICSAISMNCRRWFCTTRVSGSRRWFGGIGDEQAETCSWLTKRSLWSRWSIWWARSARLERLFSACSLMRECSSVKIVWYGSISIECLAFFQLSLQYKHKNKKGNLCVSSLCSSWRSGNALHETIWTVSFWNDNSVHSNVRRFRATQEFDWANCGIQRRRTWTSLAPRIQIDVFWFSIFTSSRCPTLKQTCFIFDLIAGEEDMWCIVNDKWIALHVWIATWSKILVTISGVSSILAYLAYRDMSVQWRPISDSSPRSTHAGQCWIADRYHRDSVLTYPVN